MSILGANTPETLIRGLGSFWSTHFKGQDTLETMYKAVETNIAQTYLDMVTRIAQNAVGSNAELSHDLWLFIDLKQSEFYADPSTGYWRVPHNTNLADVRFLQDKILYPTRVFEKGYDFDVDRETNELIFYANNHNPVVQGIPNYEDEDSELHLLLWAQDARVENYALYDHFGQFLDIPKDISTEEYKLLIMGIMSLFIKGPTLNMMEAALNTIIALPINELPDGVVSAIDTAWAGGTLITVDRAADDTVSPPQVQYVLPYGVAVSPNVTVSAVLGESQALSATFVVTDYVETPYWWEDNYIPWVLAQTLTLAQRRSRAAYYAPIYGGPDETISAWTDTGATDYGALGVLAGDILWVGPLGSEESFTITEVGPLPHLLRFAPNLDQDYISDGRYSIGSMVDPVLRKAVATDGRSLRVGGLYYGLPDFVYGGLWAHNLAWNLWYYLLKYHVFALVFDDTVVSNDNMQFIVDTVYAGKPTHTYPLIMPWSEFSDTVNADDDLALTVTVSLADTAAFDDNTLVYGSGPLYNDPLIYYGMMDRDYNTGAEAGPPATAPATDQAIYSGTVVLVVTDSMPIGTATSYSLADGVISSAGAVIDGWTSTNATGLLTSLDDIITGTPRLEAVMAASAGDFNNGTRTAAHYTLLVDNPMSFTVKVDSAAIGAASGLGAIFYDPNDNTNWSGAFGYENGGNIDVDARDTRADVTDVEATTSLGAVTTWWLKVERTFETHDTFGVYYKINDGDPWTLLNSEVNELISNDTQIALVMYNPSGNAGTLDITDLEMVIRVS